MGFLGRLEMTNGCHLDIRRDYTCIASLCFFCAHTHMGFFGRLEMTNGCYLDIRRDYKCIALLFFMHLLLCDVSASSK